MKPALLALAVATGTLASLAVGPVALALTLPTPAGRGPVLVVAPPWNGGAPARIRAAGGAVVGPVDAPLAALASGAEPEALRAAGAWLVLAPGALDLICGGNG